MRGCRFVLPLVLLIAVGALLAADGPGGVRAGPGAVTVREPAYGLPHIYADTDVELAYEAGRQVAKDRLGQTILISRVARGTLFQAFGPLDANTINSDLATRRSGYTSSELNAMFDKLPATEQAQIMAYCEGVNDIIEDIYAGSEPEPAEVSLLRGFLGLGDDLFGNATNISDQVDPNYLAPGGADPDRPNAGFQFTPELAMAIAVLQVRNFGSSSFGETSRLTELNRFIDKFGATLGTEFWDDFNFLNDPLAPVSVPDSTTPGFGGPLVQQKTADPDLPAFAARFPDYDYDAALEPLRQQEADRERIARALGAWPKLGSYAWMIAGDRSATGNPWIGGFPQTGEQTPSIMHFLELRSAEGSDHRIQAIGMAFAGAPIVLIGHNENVAWTTTTAQLKNNDFYLDELILENTDALRYNDEGTPAPMSMRTDLIKHTDGSTTPQVVWRTHERMGNGGSRTVEAFQGDRTGTTDSATATSLTDAGAFSGDYSGGYVAITAGAGAGQMRPILSNTADTVTLDAPDAWTTTPDSTSQYVAVRAGNDIIATSRERVFWLEESTTALGFSIMQRAEDVVDIRRGSRIIPSTHNFISADNQSFNGVGTDVGSGNSNIGYYSSGLSRVRQGVSPTDTRLPLDGTQPDELVYLSGTVDSAGANMLTSTGAFTGEDFSPPAFNYRYDNPTDKGSEYIVTITGGTGYRQTRRIATNDDNTLTLEEEWGTAPQAGDLFEVYEIVAMPEAINPSEGYSSNWNNKAATADDGRNFGREHRNTFIAERLAADSDWTREEQRQLNKDLAGLSGDGKPGRFLIARLREAVDAVGNGGNPDVDTVLAALEAHDASPDFGRGFNDPVSDTTIAGEVLFILGHSSLSTNLVRELSIAILSDELSSTTIGTPTGNQGRALVQHAIDAAAGGPAGAYAQQYTGDYFNGEDWRVVVRDALSDTITALGGIPADIARPNNSFNHPLSLLYPKTIFPSVPTGNRGAWEQIVEVGPTVQGEFIFPLGQSGFISASGVPDRHATSLHEVWREWRFVPMLRVAQDLATDPDGDVDNDGVLDGFERWYFGSTSPDATDDADGDGLHLLGEFILGLDPTNPDTNANTILDGDEDPDQDGCSNEKEFGLDQNLGGLRDALSFWDFMDQWIGPPFARDKSITGGDISALVARFGTVRGSVPNKQTALAEALTPPTISTGYHAQADRGGMISGQDPWDLNPPDGSITGGDISSLVAQFGHSCV